MVNADSKASLFMPCENTKSSCPSGSKLETVPETVLLSYSAFKTRKSFVIGSPLYSISSSHETIEKSTAITKKVAKK